MKKILLILGHPRTDSLCGALADAYADAAQAAGAVLRRLTLADMLRPRAACRLPRRAAFVTAARPDGSGRVLLALRDRPETVTVSRAYAHLFRQM